MNGFSISSQRFLFIRAYLNDTINIARNWKVMSKLFFSKTLHTPTDDGSYI